MHHLQIGIWYMDTLHGSNTIRQGMRIAMHRFLLLTITSSTAIGFILFVALLLIALVDTPDAPRVLSSGIINGIILPTPSSSYESLAILALSPSSSEVDGTRHHLEIALPILPHHL